jgi:phosphopantothenate synthetase
MRHGGDATYVDNLVKAIKNQLTGVKENESVAANEIESTANDFIQEKWLVSKQGNIIWQKIVSIQYNVTYHPPALLESKKATKELLGSLNSSTIF